VAIWMQAGKQRRERRSRGNARRESAREERAFIRQCVEIRRSVFRVTVAAEMVGAQAVDDYEKNIGKRMIHAIMQHIMEESEKSNSRTLYWEHGFAGVVLAEIGYGIFLLCLKPHITWTSSNEFDPTYVNGVITEYYVLGGLAIPAIIFITAIWVARFRPISYLKNDWIKTTFACLIPVGFIFCAFAFLLVLMAGV